MKHVGGKGEEPETLFSLNTRPCCVTSAHIAVVDSCQGPPGAVVVLRLFKDNI
jgi:hypothetical protein